MEFRIPKSRVVSSFSTVTVTTAVVLWCLASRPMNSQPVSSTSGRSHRTYTTKFPLTEFPISEGGNWIGGATVGKDWGDMGTASNHAYSVMPSPGANYDDPTALLTGSWGPNQTVTATVWVGTAQGEVELRLRSAMSPHVNTGYEVTWNTVPGNGYLSLTRWNGALGDWTGLGILYGDQYVVSNGDVVSATITGNIITAYKNGVQQDQWVDSGAGSFATGAPGMGADWATEGRPSSYGFSSYSASDSTTGTVSTSEFRARMNHWIHSVFSRKDTIFTTRDLVEIG